MEIAELDLHKIKIKKIKGSRKNKQKTKAIIHIENLTDEEFEAVRYNPNFIFQSEGISELMLTDSWKEPEKVGD